MMKPYAMVLRGHKRSRGKVDTSAHMSRVNIMPTQEHFRAPA